MQQWEYHFETLKGEAIEDATEICDELGADRWELITMSITNGAIVLVFKRSKRGLN